MRYVVALVLYITKADIYSVYPNISIFKHDSGLTPYSSQRNSEPPRLSMLPRLVRWVPHLVESLPRLMRKLPRFVRWLPLLVKHAPSVCEAAASPRCKAFPPCQPVVHVVIRLMLFEAVLVSGSVQAILNEPIGARHLEGLSRSSLLCR